MPGLSRLYLQNMIEPAATIKMKAAGYDDDVDRSLIEAIGRADAQAMTEFVGRHGRWVRGVLYAAIGRMDDVDDLAQRVWMQVWREAGALRDVSNWRSWLYRIARNAAMDHGRFRQRYKRAMEHIARQRDVMHSEEVRPTDESALHDERQRIILEAIESLPPLYREPFVLRHLEDMSYQRIGELLGLPVDTVETRLVRARRLLREQLAGRL